MEECEEWGWVRARIDKRAPRQKYGPNEDGPATGLALVMIGAGSEGTGVRLSVEPDTVRLDNGEQPVEPASG